MKLQICLYIQILITTKKQEKIRHTLDVTKGRTVLWLVSALSINTNDGMQNVVVLDCVEIVLDWIGLRL